MDTIRTSNAEDTNFRAAFQEIARFFGRPTSPTVLYSGIVLESSGIEDADIERLSSRIGLDAHPRDVSDRWENDLPVLIEHENGKFQAVLEHVGGNRYNCTDLETGKRHVQKLKSVKRSQIQRVFSFSTVYLNLDERGKTGGPAIIEQKHWLFGTMATFWRGYVQVALAAAFINILALASPIFIMNVYDRILPNEATASLLVLALGVVVALIFDLLLKTARAAIIDYTGRSADNRISHVLFDKVLHSTMASRPGSTGEYANRISQLEFVREFFTSNTIATIIDAFFVFIFLGVIYLIAGWLFVIPLIAFVLSILIGLVAQYRIGKRVARAANETAQRQALLVEAISTIETVKLLRAEGLLLRKWNQLGKNSSRTSEQIKQLSSGAANATQFVQQLVSVLIIIGGAYEFSQGNMTTGAIIAAVILSGRTVAPLSQIAMTLARLRQALLSLKILNMIMEQPEDRPATAGFVNREIEKGRFQFQDVAFAYPGTDYPVIKGMNLKVEEGERVGIIGKIGSGKTTIGRLLSGLYTTDVGRILIDGVDIRQYHPAEIRSAVAVVGQSTDLFAGTLKENIQIGNADASDDEIVSVARAAGVDDFASLNPIGYDLPVGERGGNLSGGQKQAVAIARLLLARPKIVFLDEPSGSMDLASERQLIANLKNAFGSSVTLIISTHRFSMLELVDRLVVLDRGNVIADGPKDKVLSALAAASKSGGGNTKTGISK